jgi:TonB family protein
MNGMRLREPLAGRVRQAAAPAVQLLLSFALYAGCADRTTVSRSRDPASGWWVSNAAPEEGPQVTNVDLPFRYPMRQFAMHVEGDVVLKLHVTELGAVLPESTRVVESSGVPALDSAAFADAGRLAFKPARRHGAPVAVSILFPVHYRRPDGPPSP